ncbi:uncharacterized protein N7515_004024 [Penicillium bovifimosum]|uniref:Uncharacterized protein n=1 Tax=Penicillium bovifimosum TaxID=126998 RepID=A0A9W9H7L0_9EURO|nr:uncharacterized protein N7515_004024 [Penicillium bovifimosum]KAJ5139176.1 hypothetical protein N7515_004024 [Penicillium bovifimosum]
MMASPLHREFGRFSFVLEETTSHDPRYSAPHSSLLAVHAAVSNIPHATGRGELIAKTMQHLRWLGDWITR